MFGWYRCKFFLPFLLCALIKELTWKHLPILCSQGQLYSDVLFAVYESVAKSVVNCVFHYDSVTVTNTLTNFLHRSQSLQSQSCEIIKWSEITNDEWGGFFIALSSHRKKSCNDKKLVIKTVSFWQFVLILCSPACPALTCHISTLKYFP